MKLFTPEKVSYGRWRYQTFQVGNIATKVLLNQIWCTSEACTWLNVVWAGMTLPTSNLQHSSHLTPELASSKTINTLIHANTLILDNPSEST